MIEEPCKYSESGSVYIPELNGYSMYGRFQFKEDAKKFEEVAEKYEKEILPVLLVYKAIREKVFQRPPNSYELKIYSKFERLMNMVQKEAGIVDS